MKKYLLIALIVFTAFVSCSKDDNADNPDRQALEIWMGQKTGSTGDFSNLRWMVVLPDGAYFNQLPSEGFLNFSQNQTGGSWGTFTMNGNSGTFTNPYETLQVNKISNTEMGIVGYVNHIYKLVSVEGLKLSGKYNTIPNWSTIPNYPYGANDPQPMFEFTTAGTFNDMGAFVTNFSTPYQDPQRAPGNGTYEIKNYTLILNYSDGRKITKAFNGAFDNQVTATSELVFIGGNPFYNH
ncbi:MAG TPA: hypothetical protein PLS87_11305 [Ferruginibacter sp.]|uniref:hypothetical protein n=1 Tax=Agriterribacter sp. TaxID=2821509 RepID=UPI002C7F6B52|nr:hypothetical protein [Agriterribacter sp.]HMM15984.1 hypothetical protein [Petrimonas sp.]HRN92999.1 hypothetical protein [Ferruginibacter sp.]HRQ19307.1 hypothetical protein [Agriterribacter sp.]